MALIGALFYFGILNFNAIMPEKIVLPEGFVALDSKVTPDNVILVIQNEKGENVVISSIALTDNNCAYNGAALLKNGDKHTFNIDCPAIQGTKLRSKVNIVYAGESGLSHTITGNIIMGVKNE